MGCCYLFRLIALILCAGLLLGLVMWMAGRGNFQVDQGQQREDQCLYKSDKQFKWDEGDISEKR